MVTRRDTVRIHRIWKAGIRLDGEHLGSDGPCNESKV